MDAQFFVFRWGVKLCVYHLGMFTEWARDQIETTGALPEPPRTRSPATSSIGTAYSDACCSL